MSDLNIVEYDNPANQITFKEIILIFKEWFFYLKSKVLSILFVGLIGVFLGVFYAWLQPITYTAKLTFVVEEGKGGASGLGGLASLAGQFGVDVGGVSNGGVLSGDNILLYFKSESLAREVLLSRFDSLSNISIADFYAEVYGLKKIWLKNQKIGKVDFPIASLKKSYSRVQDSLLQRIIDEINQKQFNITKTEKKASFIEVSAKMKNELLSKIYCDKIVKIAVDRFINIKTQRQKSVVDKLQARVDSIAKLLGKKTYAGASLQTSASTMDINPLYRTNNTIALETTIRDKSMLVSIFASVVQNLELAKFTLSQETPVIHIVDSPIFPLKMEKLSKTKTGFQFSALLSFFYCLFLVLRRIFNFNK